MATKFKNFSLYNSTEAEEAITPEMPNFQSEYGKMLSARKVSCPEKTTQQNEQNKENNQETPEMPFLNSYEANVMLSQKKLGKCMRFLSTRGCL